MAITPTPIDTSSRSSNAPLQSTGALDKYEHSDPTPVIGREFRNVQLPDLLKGPYSDELLRELAILVSQRGVVFFRDQTAALTDDQQKKLGNRLGQLSGRPEASRLHIHPTEYKPDLEMSPIKPKSTGTRLASIGWHTDISFEPVPSDFAILNMTTIPPNGGDTVWASAYEAYDRLTPEFAKFLEGLTAVHDGNNFHQRAKDFNIDLYTAERGHPHNIGPDLVATHPVIRTNPVTGWKRIFVNQAFTKKIVELNVDESTIILDYLFKLINQNHDLTVRFKWQKNDVAIWTNASTLHNVTVDYHGMTVWKGNRVVSLGERPYFDPNSLSRREALGVPKWH